MSPVISSILDIQSWWEVPCVAHFCSLFSQIFNLPDFHIEDLEEALLADGNEGQTTLLSDLIVSLLRGCDLLHKCKPHIHASNYQMFMRRLFRKQCQIQNIENPFDSDTDFQSLPLRRRLEILHSLCYFRLESKKVPELLAKLEADSLRIEPLGYDDKKSAYWYFFGTRLYREDFLSGEEKKKGKVKCAAIWQVICFTEDDWKNLAAKLKASNSRRNRALSKILYENFLPKIPKLFKEKEDQRRRNFFKKASRLRTLSLKKISEDSEKELTDTEIDNLVESTESSRNSFRSQRWSSRKKVRRFDDTRGSRSISRSSNYSTLASGSSRCGSQLSDQLLYDYSTEDCAKFVERCSSVNDNSCDSCVETISSYESSSIRNFIDCNSEKSAELMNKRQKEVKKTGSSVSKMSPTTNKLPGRQTNNSLSSLSGNIIIQDVNPGSTKKVVTPTENRPVEKVRKKNAKTSQIFTETEEVLQIGMHKVLEYVKNHKDAWPFMDPVEEDIAPRYYSIIRRPMDLLKMEEKLDNGEYATFSEFRNDFKLIVNNCRLYNGQNNEYTEMVNNLQEAFEKATKKYFEQNSSDEEDVNLEYPDLKTNVFREKYAAKLATSPTKVAGKKEMPKKSATKEDRSDDEDEDREEVVRKEEEEEKEVVKSKKAKPTEPAKMISNVKQKVKHKHQESKDPIESPRGTKRKKKEKDKYRKRKKKGDGKSDSRTNESDVEEDEDDEEEAGVEEEEPQVKKSKTINKGGGGSKEKEKTIKVVPEKSTSSSKRIKGKSAKEKPEESSTIQTAKKSESTKTSVKNNGQKKEKNPVKTVANNNKVDKVSKKKVVDAVESGSGDSIPDEPTKKKVSEKRVDSKKNKEKSPKHKEKVKMEEPAVRKSKHKGKVNADKATSKRSKSDGVNLGNVSPISSEWSSVMSQSAYNKNTKPNSKSSLTRFHKDEDLMSISSRSFSRSPSPLSSGFSRDFDDYNDSSNRGDKKRRKLPSRPPTPDIKDKFDLIKERRRGMMSGEEKKSGRGSSVSDNSKSNQSSKSPSGSKASTVKDVKDKHQTLNETIERLKLSNEKTKQRTAVIDEILGVKPPRDEKTIFERLRDPNSDMKPPKPGGKDKKRDEYDFVDDTVATPTVSSAHRHAKKENLSKGSRRNSKSANMLAPPGGGSGGSVKKGPKPNLEALEQGVWEQTLKDINRWLEPPSDSNSPSRYTWDDFETEDFRRPVPIQQPPPKTQQSGDASTAQTSGPGAATTSSGATPGTRPNAPGQNVNAPSGQQRKEARDKRKTLKDKTTVRKRDVGRPIDRLQPGKAKGNLIQNTNKPDELFPLGNLSRLKEIKNSLMVKPTPAGPKLSLGTVLNTPEFGLKQQHNFVDETKETKDEKGSEKENSNVEVEKFSEKDKIVEVKDDKGVDKEVEVEKSKEKSPERISATPNLSAWFKAFGAPKKTKKSEEEESAKKKVDISPSDSQSNDNIPTQATSSKSPMNGAEGSSSYSQPAPRQRKASTGSTISERSSYSQDPDSPRIAIIDERMYPAPYPSPLGASPILTSPKPDDLPKSASPYSLNGAIKVGFYQDTTTKSSPEKSCSPREQPATYPQYSQHVYSSATSPAMTGLTSPSYGSYPYHTTTTTVSTAADAKKTSGSVKSPAIYYDQYKPQRSEESAEYNNSMSPNANPNSPYQHQQMSPYQQQHSPYQQQQNSPFQQQQQQQQQHPTVNSGPISPYQQTPTPQQPSALSPSPSQFHQRQQQMPQPQQQQPQKGSMIQGAPVSPFSHSNHSSPYSQHDPNSPYSQQSQPEQLSPFHQNPNSPKPSNPQQAPDAANQINSTPAGTTTEWQAPSHIPSQYDNIVPPAAHGQQPLSSAQCNQEKMPPQLHRAHMGQGPPMAHHHQEMPQNMTPAHQNYPPYTSLQGKRYDDTNLFMPPSAQPMLRQQNMYEAPQTSAPEVASNLGVQNPLNYRQPPAAAAKHVDMTSQQHQSSDMINLGYNAPNKAMHTGAETADKVPPTDPMSRLAADKQQQQQMFDLLAFSKYGKQLDISTSKAFEMFNRAASMAFPKSLPIVTSASTATTSSGGNKPQPDLFDLNYGKGISQNDYPGQSAGGNARNTPQQRTITELGPMTGYQQPLKQHLGVDGKTMQSTHAGQSVHLQQSQQQHAVGGKGVDLAIPNPRQQLLHDTSGGQKEAPRYETLQPSAYKATSHPYNPAPSATLIDPSLRNLAPLPIMDEHLLSLQQSSASGYYDKAIPSAHMFSKNMHHQPAPASIQQMFSSSPISSMSPYNTARDASNVPGNNYQLRLPGDAGVHHDMSGGVKSVSQPMTQPPVQEAPTKGKRGKKKKAAAVTQNPVEVLTQNTLQQQQQQQHQQQQGFQSYAGLKTGATTSSGASTASTDSSAISLKSASMVPGSAFNFGPTPTGLGLPYGPENPPGYLDDFRNNSNPYYLPPGHRNTPEAAAAAAAAAVAEKGAGGNVPVSAPSYHQFLSHPTTRPSYPFMNTAQLDATSPIYQQYLHRATESEFRAQMMLNQGLLPPPGAPGAYPQATYHHALGMHKTPYDAMNTMNRPWF